MATGQSSRTLTQREAQILLLQLKRGFQEILSDVDQWRSRIFGRDQRDLKSFEKKFDDVSSAVCQNDSANNLSRGKVFLDTNTSKKIFNKSCDSIHFDQKQNNQKGLAPITSKRLSQTDSERKCVETENASSENSKIASHSDKFEILIESNILDDKIEVNAKVMADSISSGNIQNLIEPKSKLEENSDQKYIYDICNYLTLDIVNTAVNFSHSKISHDIIEKLITKACKDSISNVSMPEHKVTQKMEILCFNYAENLTYFYGHHAFNTFHAATSYFGDVRSQHGCMMSHSEIDVIHLYQPKDQFVAKEAINAKLGSWCATGTLYGLKNDLNIIQVSEWIFAIDPFVYKKNSSEFFTLLKWDMAWYKKYSTWNRQYKRYFENKLFEFRPKVVKRYRNFKYLKM